MNAVAGADDPVVRRAAEIAENLLYPSALAVDRADRVPAGHLDLLAAQGYYGLAAPEEDGGAGVDHRTACLVAEKFAGGCLATAFVWIQHQGVVRRASAAGRRDLLGPLCTGERRAGVALGGVLPGPPRLRATRTTGGWLLDGESPWVTGWGMLDTLLAAARTEDDTLVWALLAAREGPSLRVEPLELVAVNASGTVLAHFAEYFVPDEAVLGTQPLAEFAVQDAAGLRFNGSLALGVIGRCQALLGPTALDEAVTACRTALDTAEGDGLAAARADSVALALRISSALLVRTGSTAVLRTAHAQRLAREALFLSVFASRPAIKDRLLAHLSTPGG